MGYADSLMAKDERILYRARQHWLAPVSDARNGLLVFLAGIVIALVELMALHINLFSIAGLVPAVILVVGFVWMVVVYLTWKAEEYIITNRRVLKTEGLLDKKSGDSSLDKINDAVLKQGLLARMLRYGDLEILTANDDAIDRYEMLAHVVDFKKAMLNAKNDLEDGYRGSASPARTAAPAPGTASARPSSSDDVTATLARLADLRDKGAITPAEYDAKKAELLGRL
ncbi:MAG: PH domain-containing protein [Candidatus Limnocylindrales bacterium]|jgi:uncharacterized membrane protein YdbT with pleckstrin-like domain